MKRFSRLGERIFWLSQPFLLLVAVGVGFLNPLWGNSAWAGQPIEITILHTNNVTGHLFGCPT